ncbi:MAG: DUF4760 domain-containing protein [bacterium]
MRRWIANALHLALVFAVAGAAGYGLRFAFPEDAAFTTALLVESTVFLAYGTIIVGLKLDEWNRNKTTIDLASRWNDGEIADKRQRFRKTVLYDANAKYTRGYLDALFAHDVNAAEDLNIILNHLEIVAVALQKGIIHENPTDQLYGWPIVMWYNNFEPFIQAALDESKLENPDGPWVYHTFQTVALAYRTRHIGPKIAARKAKVWPDGANLRREANPAAVMLASRVRVPALSRLGPRA